MATILCPDYRPQIGTVRQAYLKSQRKIQDVRARSSMKPWNLDQMRSVPAL